MQDDELMDRLLRDALTAAPPQLSPAFDDRVMRRVRPRRLTPIGRLVIVVYILVAAAVAVRLMRDLPPTLLIAAVVIGVLVAAAGGAYGRRLLPTRT